MFLSGHAYAYDAWAWHPAPDTAGDWLCIRYRGTTLALLLILALLAEAGTVPPEDVVPEKDPAEGHPPRFVQDVMAARRGSEKPY